MQYSKEDIVSIESGAVLSIWTVYALDLLKEGRTHEYLLENLLRISKSVTELLGLESLLDYVQERLSRVVGILFTAKHEDLPLFLTADQDISHIASWRLARGR